MFEDVVKSIKATLYERASSPLFGAFATAWAGCNYRFIAVIFASEPMAQKLKLLDAALYPNPGDRFYFWFVYPALWTVLLIFVYPYPARFVYKFWRSRQKELLEIKQQIDDETPVTREQAIALRVRIRELEQKHLEEITDREAKITQLEKMVSARADVDVAPGHMVSRVEKVEMPDSDNSSPALDHASVDLPTSSEPQRSSAARIKLCAVKVLQKLIDLEKMNGDANVTMRTLAQMISDFNLSEIKVAVGYLTQLSYLGEMNEKVWLTNSGREVGLGIRYLPANFPSTNR